MKTRDRRQPWKTKAAVDRRHNKKTLGIAQQLPYHAVAVPTAMRNSHKDNVRSSAVGKLMMYLWWSLSVPCIYTRQVRVTVGDSGLCFCLCDVFRAQKKEQNQTEERLDG